MQARVPIDYRKFYKENPGALFECVLDEPWTIIKASNSFYAQLGHDKDSFESLFGDSFLALLSSAEREVFLDEFSKYLELHDLNPLTPPLFLKIYLRRHDRLYQPVQIFVRLIDDGHKHLSCVYMPLLGEQQALSLDDELISQDSIQEKLKQKVGDQDVYAKSFNGKTILLAEDHPLNIQMLTKKLQMKDISSQF